MNDYVTRINRVIDYIESHLSLNLTLDELSAVANFSKFHFHRIFSSITGERLSEFIQRHRLETAAVKLLQNSRTPVTEIALSCGFASSASFANSFRRRFHMSPSQWRKEKSLFEPDSNLNKLLSNPDEEDFLPLFHIEYEKNIQIWRTRNEVEQREVVVKTLPPLSLAYIRYTGPYKGDDRLFYRLWEQLMRWAGPRGVMEREDTWLMTLYHNYPELTEDDKLRLSVCLSVPVDMVVEGSIGKMDFQGGKYACYQCVLGPQDYQDAWEWIYSKWLPISGYQPADRVPMEIFPRNQNDVPEGSHRVEICIPVVPL